MLVHPDKSKALQDWSLPINLHDLRKHVLWRWRDEVEDHALRKLKQVLLDSPVLISFNLDKPFFVVSFASDYAVEA